MRSYRESERATEAQKGDAMAEKEHAEPTVVPEQLRGKKGKSCLVEGKMTFKSELAKLERKMAEQNHLLWRLTNLYPDCKHQDMLMSPGTGSSVLQLLQKQVNTE